VYDKLLKHRLSFLTTLYLAVVQEVRWDKEGTARAGDYNFFYGRRKENYQLGIEILYTTE